MQDIAFFLPRERMNDTELFTGIYVNHWEVARFGVKTGRRFFGLLPRLEKWQPLFPEGFQLPGNQSACSTRRPSEYYSMTVRGTLGPKGHFGHIGICSRQLTIVEVVSCERTEMPGRTW
jgi:hypothetical protein